jgi:predicted DNA-binding transcriptional regulator AlpA
MELLQKILSKLLRQTAEDIDRGKYECDQSEWEKAINVLSDFNKDRQMSKEEACSYLNLSRSSFDTYVRNGWIPKGKKTLGFKELSWTKEDLDIACEKIRKITGTFIKNN